MNCLSCCKLIQPFWHDWSSDRIVLFETGLQRSGICVRMKNLDTFFVFFSNVASLKKKIEQKLRLLIGYMFLKDNKVSLNCVWMNKLPFRL